MAQTLPPSWTMPVLPTISGQTLLEIVQVVMEIEEEFGVEIPDSAANTILTVGDAIRFIEKARLDGEAPEAGLIRR